MFSIYLLLSHSFKERRDTSREMDVFNGQLSDMGLSILTVDAAAALISKLFISFIVLQGQTIFGQQIININHVLLQYLGPC